MGELDVGIKTFSRVFSLSFSGKKIAIQILGILFASIASLIILGLGGLILHERLQILIAVINGIAVIFILFITWGAISKITVAEVAELPPVSIKEAINAAWKSARPLIIAPLKIVVLILVMMLGHIIADWIGLIPYLGQIIWPFFAIPLFLLSALIVVSILILICGTLLLPPIVMVGKESPVSELNDFLRENTLRFIGYLIAAVVVVSIVCSFLSVVSEVNNGLSNIGMGEKLSTIVASVPTKLVAAVGRAKFFLKNPFSVYTSIFTDRLETVVPSGIAYGAGWTYSFAGFIWGIFTLIIYLAISSLPFVVWSVSGTLIYLGLKPEAIPKAEETSSAEKE